MSDLRDLYQELILDHGRRPRNFGELPAPCVVKEGFNPLCGDRLTLFLKMTETDIDAITFQGSGCAISMASASLMTECMRGKSVSEAKLIFEKFHEMVTQHDSAESFEELGKLGVLQGVAEFPARVKCATLAWHTLVAALNGDAAAVSTE